MNKRERCEALYMELIAEGYVLPENKSLRATFIERAVAEHGLTEKGAATYYVNAKAKAEGRVKPEYHRQEVADPVDGVPNVWTIAKVEEGKVTVVWPQPTEEKALQEFNLLRPENKALCMIVPGVVRVGELVTKE